MANSRRLSRRLKIKSRIRGIIFGTTERPRLSVYRSNNEIYAQIIDDSTGKTLLSVSSLKEKSKKGATKIEAASSIGKKVGEKALSLGIKEVHFDRNGFLYHGRVKSLADGARESGLIF